MTIRKMLSTSFGVAVLSAAALASVQMSDRVAREQACNTVRSQLHLRPDQFLGIQRDENLEQSLASAVGKRAEPELIYRLRQAGVEIKDDSVVHHISTDADLVYVVAVDTAAGTSYRIHGFPDSFAEFERLISAAGMRVSSTEQAESLADFYRAVDPQNIPLTPITSLIELKQAGERQCHSGVRSFDSGDEAFTAWWNRAKRLYAAVQFQQKAMPDGGGYTVEWIVISSSSGDNCGGAPVRATLLVSSDGDVSKVILSPLRELSTPTRTTH